jgi:hypothetical protein
MSLVAKKYIFSVGFSLSTDVFFFCKAKGTLDFEGSSKHLKIDVQHLNI